MSIACPALMIAAPSSGQGKTTVTAALAAWHRQRGRRVRIFKCGPDFLDPMILEQTSGQPVYQLDLWMGSEEHCRELLHRAAREADLILVEGAMGLFDGTPSAADVAATFNLPVLTVLDASGMAQTFAALGLGLASLRDDIRIAGLFANCVASERHRALLTSYLPPSLPLLGWLPREASLSLPERHLGLMQAAEIEDLAARIAKAASSLQEMAEELPPPVEFAAPKPASLPQPLHGTTIAIACDAAFSFIYRANLDTLRELGARLEFFSPLGDGHLPEADALYLPGGYPELHLAPLSANASMLQSIRMHHTQGKPIFAECGGMLYLLEHLTDREENSAAMAGLLPGRAVMQKRFANLGMQSIRLPEGELRGHTFHYSKMESSLPPVAESLPQAATGRGEPAYRIGRLHASYLHHYFPSSPQAVAALFTP